MKLMAIYSWKDWDSKNSDQNQKLRIRRPKTCINSRASFIANLLIWREVIQPQLLSCPMSTFMCTFKHVFGGYQTSRVLLGSREKALSSPKDIYLTEELKVQLMALHIFFTMQLPNVRPPPSVTEGHYEGKSQQSRPHWNTRDGFSRKFWQTLRYPHFPHMPFENF